MQEELKYISVALLDAPGHDSRLNVDADDLGDLVESINQNGILQPLIVRPRQDRFEVIAGGRRLRAARQLALTTVPCLVRSASDSETAVLRFEENLKRADLNPVEEAKYIAEAITALNSTPQEFAEKINRSEQWINDRLTIATMPAYLQERIMSKQIGLGVALALNEITDDKVRNDWSYYAATSGMTVLAAQNALREWQKLNRYQQEHPEEKEARTTPTTPPVAYASCVRCGSQRPLQQLHFVRICNPICPTEEPGG